MKDSIQPFIHRKILVLKPDTPIQTAARAMCEQQAGSAVIADERGHFVGFVTDRDIACRGVAFGLKARAPVSEIMSTDVQCVEETALLKDVVAMMTEGGIRRVPIIENLHGGRQKCVGLVTLDDLILSGEAGIEEVRTIIRAQIRQAAVRKPELDNRSDDKKEQTYNRFIKSIARHMSLSVDDAEPVINHILILLVRRMTATVAGNFIFQLPSLVQDELFELPAGPDTTISTVSLTKDVGRLLRLKDREAVHDLIGDFWKGLEHFMGAANINFVLLNLPLDFQALFGAIGGPKVARSSAARRSRDQQPLPAGGSS